MGKHYFKCLACGREKYEHFGVKYFKLPENSERKAKWLNCINKQHLIHEKISRDSRICERHFSKDMYGKSTMRLKWSATPNLDILKNISNITEGNIDHSITSNETEGFIHVPLNEIVQMKKSLSYCESVNTPVEEADKSLSEGIAANEVFDFIVETSPKGHKPTQTSFTESEKIAHENTATKITACRKNIVGNYIECSTSTWSAECSFSIKTENEDYHPAQHNPDEVVAVKSEYSQDSWSCYRGSESSFLTQEGLQDNRDFESPASIKSSRGKCNANDAILDAGVADMHSKYGAYIADRLSIANRTKSEVNIAQMLIESIMLNLLSGVYAYSINCVDANEVGQKEKAPSLPTSVATTTTTESTVNAIVVKEEVDL